MTDGFRCSECERILTRSTEFQLGTCVDCEPRPTLHPFEDTPDGTCGHCGYLYEIGGHEPLEPALDREVPAPQPCPLKCGHYSHRGPCPDGIPGPGGRGLPCRCPGSEVAA